MIRTSLLVLAVAALSRAASPGYVSIAVDSIPTKVYVDAVTVVMNSQPRVLEVEPGKHFVSLFPPRKVYLASSSEAPEQFWEKLRNLGVIGGEYDLLSSYEAGSVRVGTAWIYVAPAETTAVQLSRAAADQRYRRDSGCVTTTFLGWVLLIGAAMIGSVLLLSVGS